MSRRFLLYLILLGVTFALYSYSAISQLLFLLIVLLALPLCSLLLLFIARYFVQVDLTCPKKQIYRLEPFYLILDIRNRGPFFFPLIRIEFDLPREGDALMPVRDWQKGLQAASEGVHFFNEYLDGPYSEGIDDKALAPGESGKVSGLDRRRTFRFYPYPHFAMVRKIITAVVPQMSTSHQRIEIFARHRGVYEIGTDSILLQDLFGFFYLPLPRVSRKTKEGASRLKVEIEVLPNPARWHSPRAGKLRAPEQVLMNARDLKVSNEVDTLANVRDYRPGDRIKQIHWKLSARSDKFLAREFEDPRQGGILFILDPKLPDDCADPMTYADEAPEIMASIMRLLAQTEGPLNLVLGEDYFTAPGEGEEPFSFYKAMMHWKPEIKRDDPRVKDPKTRQSCHVLPHRLELATVMEKECFRQRYRAIVIITARMNEQLANQFRRAQKIGSQVLLVFLHNEPKPVLDKILAPLSKSSVRLFPTRLDCLIPYEEALSQLGSGTAGKSASAGSSPSSAGPASAAKPSSAPPAGAGTKASPADSAESAANEKEERSSR